MSIYKLNPDNFEYFTLETNPTRNFSSSSSGLTGSIKLFARRSDTEKEVRALSAFADSTFTDEDIEQKLIAIKRGAENSTNINSSLDNLMTDINNQSVSARKQKELEIIRFEPSFTYTKDTQRKNVVRNILFPQYRSTIPTANWAYSNYHCLNFFTASSVPSSAVLLYPNSASNPGAGAVSGSYVLDGPFTFEFFINPNKQGDTDGVGFKAGTIFHLSSSYAVSLISGSRKDHNAKTSGYRIQLQLSHSADVLPSIATPGSYPNDLIFQSNDNSLKHNNWHHVAIRWGTNSINDGSGSFIVDGVEQGVFNIPSSSISPQEFASIGNPDVLAVGNYYEGENSGGNAQGLFFAKSALRDGLVELVPGDARDNPANFTFNHPLNAEIHELRIFDKFRTLKEIVTGSQSGLKTLDNLKFYVPPFFGKDSPKRTAQGTHGGVLQTPFFSIDSSTDDPFNVALSFGVGGHYLNLENFTKDYANDIYPRLFNLTGSEIPGNSPEALTANQYLNATGSIRYRNLFMPPCDNGIFKPNFNLFLTSSVSSAPISGTSDFKHTNDLGIFDPSLISLTDLIPPDAFKMYFDDSGDTLSIGKGMDRHVVGATPENLGVDPGEVLSVFQRTRDNSSNEVVFFDISNMFYGKQVDPGSFQITDNSLTGSDGKVSMTLRDDKHGNLYRANALTKHATWNSVGNIFYNEGIAVVKSPNIPLFGTDQFEVNLKGSQALHTMKISVPCGAGQFNSSSNRSYLPISATLDANEPDNSFVYITGINFHDQNLNVIMKTNFAQPIMKKGQDRYLFRVKTDF